MKTLFVTLFSITLHLVFLSGCGRNSVPGGLSKEETGNKPRSSDVKKIDDNRMVEVGSGNTLAQEIVKATLTDVEAVTKESRTEEIQSSSTGQRHFLLTARAMTQQIAKCFYPNPRSGDPNAYFASHPDEFFTPDELLALGKRGAMSKGFTLTSGGGPSESFKNLPSKYHALMRRKTALDQAYLYALRSFLGTACRNLVTKDIANLPDIKNTNLFIKSERPTAENISSYMSCLYGFSPSKGLHLGASDYATLFADDVSKIDKNNSALLKEAQTENYIQMCVALGTDPRFYSR